MEEESQSESLIELEPPTLPKASRKHRRRRRSSARFLRLTGRLMEEEEEENEEEEEPVESEQHLGDMYKKAIRMNAENRINATNSWNLRLIENIDKFLEDEQETESPSSSRSNSPELVDESGGPLADATNTSGSVKSRKNNTEKRVNFTKASCTLDASVKIYSYRVDDVHLTSYKVLANLNRTDTKKSAANQSKEVGSAQTQGDGDDALHDDDDDNVGHSKSSSKNTGTLETNIANINMNKLDSAFDIDPLFHKMSKTFDEGGAKGLLLVNLSVGEKGCNIVFDSKAECEEEERTKSTTAEDTAEERQEGMVDISSLLTKLDSTTMSHPIESLSLVPQLASLRDQFASLKEEGFVEKKAKTSKRYASTQAEEKEADMSIHQEAMERSRMSQGMGRSFATHDNYDDDNDDAPQFGDDDDDDFGGGGGDDDGDMGFDNFMANMDDNEPRFSSVSFRESFATGHNIISGNDNKVSQEDVLLDAICSGNVLGSGQYSYFDSQALETAMAGNLWAGATHWKRTEPTSRRRQEKEKKSKTTIKRTKKSKAKGATFVDLTAKPVLEDILRKPPTGKRGVNPLQLSKAMVTKHTKENNLLPPDSGMGVDKLAGLFLRPNAVVQPSGDGKAPAKGKTVCFGSDVETFGGFDDHNSFGGDDDGGGFGFGDDNDDAGDNENDFVMEELKDVRKVDTKNVQVGYATVAKKVDVRRLKKDLWTGIETSIAPAPSTPKVEEENSGSDDDSVMKTPEKGTAADGVGLSFQETVKNMEESKSQVDVTLPFYFICILHLANEKGLRLESTGLQDFVIHDDAKITAPSV